jgi:4-hydroxymandelate oxidase
MDVSRRHALKSGFALGASAVIDRTASLSALDATSPPGAATAGAASALAPLLTLDDYERAARQKMPPTAWEYLASGAADELSVRWNVDAYRSLRLVPRQLRDVSTIDMGVALLGQRLPHPILLAPTACHKLAHPDGEVGSARGARAAKAGMVLSSYSTVPVEQVAREKPSLFWFQLYVQDRAYTERLVRRAVAAGATAIAVTIDTPVAGARNRQERSGFVFPPNLPHISGNRPEHPLTWKDLEWIQRAAGVPILLKGVLHPDDADLAVKAGAAGIMVSNHGGRNLDTALATIDALPPIVDRVAGRVPVIVDGGIRRGTDVLKALANGARAVMIGRPFVHGLAVNGAAGVEAVIEILRRELEMAMALSGCATISSVDRSILAGTCRRP